MKCATIHAAMRRLIPGAVGLGVLALALPGAAYAKDYMLVINNMSYAKVPADLKIGDAIIWINQDSVPHTVTARDKSFNLAVDRGAKVRQVLTTAGTFAFYCRYHPMMRGTLKVASK